MKKQKIKVDISFTYEFTVEAADMETAQEQAVLEGLLILPQGAFEADVRPRNPYRTFKSVSDMYRYCEAKGMVPCHTQVKSNGAVSVILTKKQGNA